MPYEKELTDRAKSIPFAGHELKICSAEDLVVLKAFANRPRDWSDVEGILLRQKGKLDEPYMLTQLGELASTKPDQPIVKNLQALLQAWDG